MYSVQCFLIITYNNQSRCCRFSCKYKERISTDTCRNVGGGKSMNPFWILTNLHKLLPLDIGSFKVQTPSIIFSDTPCLQLP